MITYPQVAISVGFSALTGRSCDVAGVYVAVTVQVNTVHHTLGGRRVVYVDVTLQVNSVHKAVGGRIVDLWPHWEEGEWICSPIAQGTTRNFQVINEALLR